jgi:hypothetical protein
MFIILFCSTKEDEANTPIGKKPVPENETAANQPKSYSKAGLINGGR